MLNSMIQYRNVRVCHAATLVCKGNCSRRTTATFAGTTMAPTTTSGKTTVTGTEATTAATTAPHNASTSTASGHPQWQSTAAEGTRTASAHATATNGSTVQPTTQPQPFTRTRAHAATAKASTPNTKQKTTVTTVSAAANNKHTLFRGRVPKAVLWSALQSKLRKKITGIDGVKKKTVRGVKILPVSNSTFKQMLVQFVARSNVDKKLNVCTRAHA